MSLFQTSEMLCPRLQPRMLPATPFVFNAPFGTPGRVPKLKFSSTVRKFLGSHNSAFALTEECVAPRRHPCLPP